MEKVITKQFSRFLVVGIINTVVGLSTMFLLLHLQLNYWVSTFVGNAVGACVSYFLNRTFTFNSTVSIHKSIVRFLVVIGACYFIAYYVGIQLATSVIWKLANLPLAHAEVVAVLLGTGLYTVLNFLGQRTFVFDHRLDT
ncbi:GtrA family protein [Aquibacillus salsiterrae]|uniref:GtrA family protein n=1 Tax=Aquibacillus salsiterrae TaxID=2950439 RepID=A0A9X4AGB6_9BACI|nr:GtrA family protein [Aquibacillus salsiterrae]MDC3418509.1 GtrA family protein [Aquibacillus salsiterrae]